MFTREFLSGSSHFSFFGESYNRTKKSADVLQIFHRKINIAVDFFVYDHYDPKTKNGMNKTKEKTLE